MGGEVTLPPGSRDEWPLSLGPLGGRSSCPATAVTSDGLPEARGVAGELAAAWLHGALLCPPPGALTVPLPPPGCENY